MKTLFPILVVAIFAFGSTSGMIVQEIPIQEFLPRENKKAISEENFGTSDQVSSGVVRTMEILRQILRREIERRLSENKAEKFVETRDNSGISNRIIR